MKVTRFSPNGLNSVLGGVLTGTIGNAGSAQAINGVTVLNAAASNYHIVAVGSNEAYWFPHEASSGSSPVTQVWEAVTDGEDVFVWEGDDLVHEWRDL